MVVLLGVLVQVLGVAGLVLGILWVEVKQEVVMAQQLVLLEAVLVKQLVPVAAVLVELVVVGFEGVGQLGLKMEGL